MSEIFRLYTTSSIVNCYWQRTFNEQLNDGWFEADRLPINSDASHSVLLI